MDKTLIVVVAAVVMATATVRAGTKSELVTALDGEYDVSFAMRESDGGRRRAFTTAQDANGNMVHDESVSFEVEVFGERLVLDLVRNDALFAPDYIERTYDADHNVVSETTGRENCYYIGKVKSRPDSVVAMSTCDGLSGFLRLGRDSPEIHTEPAHRHLAEHATSDPSRRHDVTQVAQIFYREEARRTTDDTESACGLDAALANEDFVVQHAEDAGAASDATPEARRRSTNYMEWAIVNDESQATWCAGSGSCSSPEARAAELANNVAGRYRDTDGGMAPAVEIVLVEQRTWAGGNPISVTTNLGATLTAFTAWRDNAANTIDKNYNDAAQLLSHVNFAGGVGLGNIGRVCKTAATSVVQDDATIAGTSHTMAHELGHNWDMAHDASGACTIMTPCNCGQDCSASGGTTDHWSQASKDAYAAYQATQSCLANIPGQAECASLPPLGSGQTAGNCAAPTASGVSCTLGCDAGLVPTGGSLDTTCDDGTWSAVVGQCVLPCAGLPAFIAAANAGDCVADLPSGESCTMACNAPYAPAGGALGYTCTAGAWSAAPAGVACYFETPIDADGVTEIGTAGTAATIDPADVTGTTPLLAATASFDVCAISNRHDPSTNVIELEIVDGALNGNTDVPVALAFLPGTTQSERDATKLYYCITTAGNPKWSKVSGGGTVDHTALTISGVIPKMAAVAGFR
jgi:hypothetical protein